ncbi:O-succinylbenzoate synthase [Brevibacterium sanguinis]|uniref:O-succinylbenzoate synthase n=2 Tax=Brevibacterium TaxID=1696 RepID=A0A366IEE9_9MICO|nr:MULTISPECIES: o-succinylbenzoate synthase [Brevibacterium]RBP63173.1 O-succinylbenzoate synthase [Brevibacterium sanguinis]RBP69651.1 O-succinylbenzoate synthase [Brevibacterium celere]
MAESPPARIVDLLPEFHVVRLPMVTRFRGITEREVLLFEGPAGWAEFSPFVEYDVPEAARWLRAALEFAGCPVRAGADVADMAQTGADRSGADRSGADRSGADRTIAETPDPLPSHVEVNATLPACRVEDVEPILARFGPVGTVKAKIAERGLESLPEDLERLGEFRRLFPSTVLRLDANAGYSLPEAVRACTALARFDLQYVEQPVAAVEDMARLRSALAERDLPVVLAADESIRKAEDPLRVARLGAAEVIIVKVQPLGGIAAARAVVAECGLPAVVSSALESSVGLPAGAQLAATLPVTARSRELLGPSPACGLGTARLFAEDVVSPGLTPVRGRIPTTRIAPDPDRLKALAVAPGRREWWSTRLQECWDLLLSRRT